VRLIGLEPGGKGIATGEHGSAISAGKDGILHGSLSRILSTKDGQVIEAYSVSAGLDYPGVGPEHAHLAKIGRVHYSPINDKDALDAFYLLSQKEGIIPALESAHAIAYLSEYAKTATPKDIVIINLSGRGDKDVDHVWALTHENSK
jgi:tryptophan synthase beta chain